MTNKIEQLILLQKAGVEYFCLNQRIGMYDRHIVRIITTLLSPASHKKVGIEIYTVNTRSCPYRADYLVPITDLDVLREDEWRNLASYSGYADIDIKASVETAKGVTLEKEKQMRTKHYDSQVQPINAMQANMSKEEFQGYCLGNIVKYCLRFGKKDGEDLQKEANKIADYAEFLRVHTKGETIDPKAITGRHKEN